VAIQRKLMTAGELAQLSEISEWYELVRGELRVVSLPDMVHGAIVANLGCELWEHVRASGLGRAYGRIGCLLETNPDTVRAPAIAFIRQERLAAKPQPGYWVGAPDLVVEIISPSDRYREVDEKVAEWLAYGPRMVLAVNPRWHTVLVYRPGGPPRLLTEEDTLDGEDVVPGWRLPVRDIFA
jgi:Uma2 family endonuclease